MKRLLPAALLLLFCAASAFAQPAKVDVPLADRAWVATRIYSLVRTNFGHWRALAGFDFDEAYREYLNQALATSDRREFDLLTMAFIARLKNGHSGFGDKWLRDHFGQRIGFFAIPIDGKWVVTRSEVPELKAGDVLLRLDGEPMDAFYARLRPYLSASDERWAHRSLFEHSYLFPPSFDLELEGGRHVAVTRKGEFQWPGSEQADVTIRDDAGALYIRIPSFGRRSFEEAAVAAVKAHLDAKAIIIDVRDNHGGSTPSRLVAALMDRPYSYYAESTPVWLPLFGYRGEVGSSTEIRWSADAEEAAADAYKGALYLLVDGGCFSACEDFAMPFKSNKRATLVGETTAGSSGQPIGTALWDGMALGLGAKRESFPDGREFEGVGIAPDVLVHATADDVRSGRDRALEKARELIDSRR